MFLPVKKSNKWFMISTVVFFVNIIAIFESRSLLGLSLNSSNIIVLVGISFLISAISSTGFFGIKILPVTVLIGNIIGIVYMYFIILGNRAQGWNDITSMIGLLYFVALGIAFGGLMEIIYKLMGGNILMKKK